MGRRLRNAPALFKESKRGGKPKRKSRPRVCGLGQLGTIAHRTLRNQTWRKRKHKGVDSTRDSD